MSACRVRPRRAASRTAAHLTIHARSSIPVPRPTTVATSTSHRTAMSVDAGVVLPMPMSPAISRSAPASTSWSAIAIPARTACSASATVIAGPTAMSPELRRTLKSLTPGRSDRSASTDMSTTRTLAPVSRASTFTAAPPATKLRTICAVTSGG